MKSILSEEIRSDMKRISGINEGVEIICDLLNLERVPEWSIIDRGNGEFCDTLVIDEEKYPLFLWRFDGQFHALKEMSGNLRPVCFKLNCCTERSYGLERLMFREFDLAEYILDSEIKKLNAFINGSSANILASMANGKTAVFELGATLADGTADQGKHTVWGKDGQIADRVISEKCAPQEMYIYTDDSRPYSHNDDVGGLLYGLTKKEVVTVSALYKIFSGKTDVSDWNARAEKYKKYIELAKESDQKQKSIVIGE